MEKNTLYAELSEFLPGDEVFAEAWEQVADNRRALLKTCIARLWDWYGAESRTERFDFAVFRSGLEAETRYRAVNKVVFMVDASVRSASALLAAVVPALVSGVDDVAVIRPQESEWPAAMLVAMEVAGVEAVASVPADVWNGAAQLVGESGRVVCLGVGNSFANLAAQLGQRAVLLSVPDSATVLQDEACDPFDVDALEFALEGVALDIFEFDSESDPEFDPENVCENAAAVVYAPAFLHESLPPHVKCAFGVGMEGCLAWPELRKSFFTSHSICWNTGE